MSKGTVNIKLFGGVPFVFLAFFTAKILHYIDWSWWVVTMPLWLGMAILLSIILIPTILFIIGISIAFMIDSFRAWRRSRKWKNKHGK